MSGKQTKRRRRPGHGSIVFIASLLIASSILRFGSGVGQAIAKDTAAADESSVAKNAEQEMSDGTPSQAKLTALLAAFQSREQRISEQERQIDVRLKALTVADQHIAARMKELEDAEAKLRATLAIADTAAEDDLLRLTTVYENMKPKDAAALFETMEPDFAAGFLGRMRPDAAAGIMAGLSPQAAYTISVILAGRNANAPKS
ncbi:MAG: hypothetical protein WBC93_02025 [Sulfitobacter sp.]